MKLLIYCIESLMPFSGLFLIFTCIVMLMFIWNMGVDLWKDFER